MFASQLILGFRHLLRDSFACCRFPIQWEVLKHSSKRANGNMTLWRLLCPADVGVMLSIFTQLVVWKVAALKVLCAKLYAFGAAPSLHFTPRTLICSLIKSCAEAFGIHIPCIKTQSRPQVWALRFELIKSPRGLGELDRWLSLVCFVASSKVTLPQHLFFHAFSCQPDVSPRWGLNQNNWKSMRVGGWFTFQTLMHIAFAMPVHLSVSRHKVL